MKDEIQAKVYGVTIQRLNSKWQVKYHYDGEIGSFLISSLVKAQKWCDERQLTYQMIKEVRDG